MPEQSNRNAQVSGFLVGMAKLSPRLTRAIEALTFLLIVCPATLCLHQSLLPAPLKHFLRASDFREHLGHKQSLTWARFYL